MRRCFTWLVTFPIIAECSDVLWSGIFNAKATAYDFDLCRPTFACRVPTETYNKHRVVVVESNWPLAMVHPWHRVHGQALRAFTRFQESS